VGVQAQGREQGVTVTRKRWPLKVTFVWDCRSRSMSFEMGSVFTNEKRMVLILFRERASFNLMVKGITLVGRTWNNLKSESFCFAIRLKQGEDLSWKSSYGCQLWSADMAEREPLAIAGRVTEDVWYRKRIWGAAGIKRNFSTDLDFRRDTRSLTER